MGLIYCPGTSVTNYQSMLCNVPEERKFHLHRCVSLKSRVLFVFLYKLLNQQRPCFRNSTGNHFEMRNCRKTPSFEVVERQFASDFLRSSYLHPAALMPLCAEPRLSRTYVSDLKILIFSPLTFLKVCPYYFVPPFI